MQSNLRAIREANGITGAALARKADLSDATIRRAENGRVTKPATLNRILIALNSMSQRTYTLVELFPGSA